MATYAELQAQIEVLRTQAEELRKSEIAAAVAQIHVLMNQFGLTVDDLGPQTRAKSPVAAKYKDPNSDATWSGRGRTPSWLAQAEAAGRNRDEFLIA